MSEIAVQLRIKYPTGATHEHVKAAGVRSFFASVFGPQLESIGFRRLRDDLWVTDSALPVRHGVALRPYVGRHRVIFGLRFDGTPRFTNDWKLVRSTKRDPPWVALDLNHDPYQNEEHRIEDPYRLDINAFLGNYVMEQNVLRECAALIPEIARFVDLVRTPVDAVVAYELERNRPTKGLDFSCFTQHAISYPYVLMMAGLETRAEQEFVSLFHRMSELKPSLEKMELMLYACKPDGN